MEDNGFLKACQNKNKSPDPTFLPRKEACPSKVIYQMLLGSRAKTSVNCKQLTSMPINSDGKLFCLVTITAFSLTGEQKALLPHKVFSYNFEPFADPHCSRKLRAKDWPYFYQLPPTSFNQFPQRDLRLLESLMRLL